MDVSDVIARREFMPTYIWLDVAFLIGFAALLVWRRKYMMLLVGLVMGGVYFAVDYGAFNLLTHSRSISGGSMFWVLLWMSVSYGFTNFSWLWLWLSRDRHLAEWSMLIPVWWFCCPLMSQTFTARFASGMQPIVIQRTTGAHHGWMAVILSRRCMVGHAVCRRSAWIPADQARDRRKISETPDVRTYQHQPDAAVQSYNNRSHRLSTMVFEPSRPVDDGLDVVAVRIQHECGIVPRMIRARSRSAVVSAADGACRGMETPHGLTVRGEERDMRGRRRERGIIQRRHVEVGVRRPVIHAETQRGLVVGLDDVAEWRERMLVERDAASDVPHMQCDVIQHTCHCTRSISHMTAVSYSLVIRYHPPKVPSRAKQMGLWADDGALRGMAGTAEDTTAMATGTANGHGRQARGSHGTCFSPRPAQIILRDATASQHHMAR